jgi:IS30 family transposase
MDTVEGKKGGKVILTIFFRNCDLQLMYLRSANTAKSVTEIFRHLRRTLGARYREIFPLVLTDRGSEFTDPQSIELDTRTLETVTRMFYCDPLQTNQKSRCERNHEYIRYIIPQSTALDPFSQEDIRNVMNHVNSMPRPGLNGKTPYDVFVSIYGQDIAGILGLEGIPLDKLCLKPALLKKTTK